MKIAILTGGGHVSGLNAGIEGISKEAIEKGWEVLGAAHGWEGMEKGNFVKLTKKNTNSIREYGGSVLGSGRWRPDLEAVMKNVEENQIDGIVALGGDDTLGVLKELWEKHNIPSAGWPKTMDNDLGGTYFSIGYPQAVKKCAQTVLESFDVATTHRRIALTSVFGRSTDWVAAGAAAYGDADMVIPGERTTNLNRIYDKAKEAFYKNKEKYGRPFATIVVAEGASIEELKSHVKRDGIHMDDFGHPKLDPHELVSSLSDAITTISEKDGQVINTAPMTLTYQLRNGRPSNICRDMGYKCGRKCVELLADGETSKMASIKREDNKLKIGSSDLSEGVLTKKVRDTNYINYKELQVTDSYLEYARPFLEEKGHREIHLL